MLRRKRRVCLNYRECCIKEAGMLQTVISILLLLLPKYPSISLFYVKDSKSLHDAAHTNSYKNIVSFKIKGLVVDVL